MKTPMKTHHRLLLTGAAGGLGTALRDRLKANCETLRLSDKSDVGEAQAGEEIVLADRGFCGWGFIALLQRKQADVVLRLHQLRRPQRGRVTWPKPQRSSDTWDQSLWAELPDELGDAPPTTCTSLTPRRWPRM